MSTFALIAFPFVLCLGFAAAVIHTFRDQPEENQ